MFTVFLVIQVLVTLALVGIILLQRSESDGLSGLGGGGGTGSLMTGRAAASFLTRTTAVLATMFMLNSLWLAILVSNEKDSGSLAEQIAAEDPLSPLQKTAPAADDVSKAAQPTEVPAAVPEEPEPAKPAAPVNVPTPE